MEVAIMVAIPAVASHAPDHNYDIEHFVYNQENDSYICPQKQILSTNGRWYNKDRTTSRIRVKHYKTNACLCCPVFEKCTANKKGRLIERSEYTQYIEQNKRNIEAGKEIYKQRQCIVEHPYGIIKRQWGFNYIMTKKGKERASADVGFIFVAYNLRRLFNLLDKNAFKKFLKELALILIRKATLLMTNKAKISIAFSQKHRNLNFKQVA